MKRQASPSFSMNPCSTAIVVGSEAPPLWYSTAPANSAVLLKEERSSSIRPSSRSGFTPSPGRRNIFSIKRSPYATEVFDCSTPRTVGYNRAYAGPRSSAKALVRVPNTAFEPERKLRPR